MIYFPRKGSSSTHRTLAPEMTLPSIAHPSPYHQLHIHRLSGLWCLPPEGGNDTHQRGCKRRSEWTDVSSSVRCHVLRGHPTQSPTVTCTWAHREATHGNHRPQSPRTGPTRTSPPVRSSWAVLLGTFPLEKFLPAPQCCGPCPAQAPPTSGSLPLFAHCRSYTATGAASGQGRGRPRSRIWCRLSTRERTHTCQYSGRFRLDYGARAVGLQGMLWHLLRGQLALS